MGTNVLAGYSEYSPCTPLPSTFRLTGPFRFEIGEAIQKQLLNDMAEPLSVTIEGAETITVPPTTAHLVQSSCSK